MTYHECEECGQLANFADVMSGNVRRRCPVCDELTVWKTAFVDENSGVSF